MFKKVLFVFLLAGALLASASLNIPTASADCEVDSGRVRCGNDFTSSTSNALVPVTGVTTPSNDNSGQLFGTNSAAILPYRNYSVGIHDFTNDSPE